MLLLALTGIAGAVGLSDEADLDSITQHILDKLGHRGKSIVMKLFTEIGEIRLIQFYTEPADLSINRKDGVYFVMSGRIFNLREAMQNELKIENLFGYYAMAITDMNKLWICRDRTGLRPIFYGFTENCLVFASEKRAIRNLTTPIRLPPGTALIVQKDGIRLSPVRVLQRPRPTSMSETEATRIASELISQAVEKLAEDEIAIMFSGGLDSTIIAKVASRFSDVHLFTAAMPGSHDYTLAKKTADTLGLPLTMNLIQPEDLEYYLERTVCVIDDWDPLKVLIGIPIYVTCEKIRDANFKVVFTGQGADELFGGYAKYATMTTDEFIASSFTDILTLAAKNLERDECIAAFNGLDIRLPYLDDSIIDFSLMLPPELKIKNHVRKYILRLVAILLGIPSEIAFTPKKAVQYSTGVAKFIKKLAKKKNLSLGSYFKRIYDDLC